MSNLKLRSPSRGNLLRLVTGPRPAIESTWRLASAKGTEATRWVSSEGQWIALTICDEELGLGLVVVKDSSGRHETVDSYEAALALAKSWRLAFPFV